MAETEMLRHPNKEFRGNDLPGEQYSRLVRGGAVMRTKNACDPTTRDVNIRTPAWAVEAATALGERTAHRIAALGVRVVGDPGLLFQATEPAPEAAAPAHDEPRLDPEVAAQALYGALAATAGASGGTRAPGRRVRFIRLRRRSS
jgi:hypothetical protein